MLKILILSASIGSGHTKAAETIQLGIRNEELGIEVRVVDFMAKEISTLNWLTKKFYLAALKFIPDLYDRIYKFADGKKVGVSARFLSSALMYLPFARRRTVEISSRQIRQKFSARNRLNRLFPARNLDLRRG